MAYVGADHQCRVYNTIILPDTMQVVVEAA